MENPLTGVSFTSEIKLTFARKVEGIRARLTTEGIVWWSWALSNPEGYEIGNAEEMIKWLEGFENPTSGYTKEEIVHFQKIVREVEEAYLESGMLTAKKDMQKELKKIINGRENYASRDA